MTAAASKKSDAVDCGNGLWSPSWCASCEHRRQSWCEKHQRLIWQAWRMVGGCERQERSSGDVPTTCVTAGGGSVTAATTHNHVPKPSINTCLGKHPAIVIDTREQRPYDFPGTTTVRRALPSGDYSLDGLENCIAIERKSLDDWINTILRSRARFRRELRQLQSYEFAAIVIEASIADILSGNYKSQISPESLLGLTCKIMQSYPPVQVIFAGDRPHAARIVEELLMLRGREDHKWL